MDLSGQTVVITGASRGLGAGMARWFLDHGATVGACARHEPDLRGAHAVTAAVDVTDASRLAEFAGQVAARLGPIDLWINNAGVLDPVAPLRELSWADLEAHLRINLGGVLNGTKAYLDHLDQAGRRGALVNVSSGLAQRGLAGTGVYAAGKAGVDRLTETFALEERERLRLALAVSPGVVETDMQRTIRAQDESVVHEVGMFRRYHEEQAMNTPAWVAEHIAQWVFGGASPERVVVRVPPQSP